MKWSWKLGRFLGIDVHLHFTFLLMLGFIALRAVFSGGGWWGAVEGVGFMLALFGCVLLHEYGHALAARTVGVGTRDITLYPIGGVAQLERMPRNPWHELWVAAAGPLVNVVIAAGLFVWLGATNLFTPLDQLGFVQGSFAAQLLGVNVSLVLFNLLPAFPMDGGRMVRAVLALWLDYAQATRIAATLGKGFAVLFGLAGFWFGNFSLGLIALFIWFAASQEANAAEAPRPTVLNMGEVLYEPRYRPMGMPGWETASVAPPVRRVIWMTPDAQGRWRRVLFVQRSTRF